MVYKRWITKDGKKTGPYYYKSVRQKDGSVKSVYIGNKFEDNSETSENLIENKSFKSGFSIGLLLGMLLVAGFIAGFGISSILSGFFVKELHEQRIDITASQSGEYPITLQEHPEKFKLDYFAINGKITGDGKVKVYLENDKGEDLLVLDSSKLRTISGKIVDNQEMSENLTINETVNPEESLNLTVPAENQTAEINQTAENEKPAEDEEAKEYEKENSFNVIGTHSFKNKIFNENLKLNIEIEGNAKINIRTAEYSAADLSFLEIKGTAEIDSEVYQQLAEKGTADIIIELKKDESNGKNIAQVEDKKGKVLSSLKISQKEISPDDDFKLTHRYKRLSAIAGEITPEGLAKLASDPNIKAIKTDIVAQIVLSNSAPLMNATSAWKTQVNGINITGAGETVCVLDTGINKTHPSLNGKVLAEYCYCSVSGSPGCCANGNTTYNSALDDNSHGTHVAGIVSSNDAVYRGIAPGSNLIAVKVCNAAGSCSGSDIIDGIEYCAENAPLYNISAISISIGGGGYTDYCDSISQPMTDAINNAVNAGIIVTVASANDGFSDKIAWPACIKNATSVGAASKTDVIYYNRAGFLDLLATGVSITSTGLTGFTVKSGTSMATPHAAAAFALLKQYYKLYNGKNIPGSYIEEIFKRTGKLINDSSTGLIYPRINILEAMNSINKINETEKSIESSNAKIIFNETVSFDSNDIAFTMKNNFIELDSVKYPQFNKSADITFYNLAFEKTPIILKNGILCQDCRVIAYNNGSFSFSVQGFTNYTAGPNSLLEVWNSDNTEISENADFYANYTNRTSGIIVSNATCKIEFSDSSSLMAFNLTKGIYEFSRAFSAYGNYSYDISCNHTDFETLNAADTIEINKKEPAISITLNDLPYNLTVLNNTLIKINATLIDPSNENLSLFFNNSFIGAGNSVYNETALADYGRYNVTAFFNETANYTSSLKALWINVVNDNIAPAWSNSKTSPSSAYYSQNQSYQFNITWQDNIAVSAVVIEHNFNGSLLNYTVNNSYNNEYYYSWLDLKAGDYTVRWHANDSAGNANKTEFIYPVSKKQSQLRLKIDDEEDDDITVRHKEIEIEATLIVPPTGNVTIKKGSTELTSGISSLKTEKNFTSGNYIINASYIGNENHTPVSVSRNLIVNLSSSSSSQAGATAPAEYLIQECTENWQCSAWNLCANGVQTRACSDSNDCGTNFNKPAESQPCSACTESWSCSSWSNCTNGIQTRICSDANSCATAYNKPPITQNCMMPAPNKTLPEKIIDAVKNTAIKAFSFVKNTSITTYTAVKTKPIIIGFAVGGILIIFALIKFSPSAANYLRSIKIVRVPAKTIKK